MVTWRQAFRLLVLAIVVFWLVASSRGLMLAFKGAQPFSRSPVARYPWHAQQIFPLVGTRPAVFDAFCIENTTAVFMVNTAMLGGLRNAVARGLHGIADTVGGDVKAGSISFACLFPSGTNDTSPVVFGSNVEDAGQEW
jgi:hypothetical protein